MSRRQRSTRESAQRSRIAREKALRRRARTRRAATAAAAAMTLAGGAAASALPASAGPVASSAALRQSSPDSCAGATTPDSYPTNLTDVDGTLFFTAQDAAHGTGLWRTDGTEAGTVRLKTLRSSGYRGYDVEYKKRGYDGYGGSSMIGVDGTLFFTSATRHGDELWRSDGTKAGTVLVRRFDSVGGGYGGPGMTAVGDTLFFTADDGTHGDELWRSDGTAAGTAMVKAITPADAGGYYSYGPSNLTTVGDQVFFTADDGTHGSELWRSDGSKAGTVLVKDIRPGSYSSYSNELSDIGGVLYFRARDGVHGRELWRSDGTEAGTELVADIRPGGASSSPEDIVGIGDTVFFSAEDGTHGRDLWTSDGTEAGTVLVKDLGTTSHGDYDYGVSSLTPVGDTLFFAGGDDDHGTELWTSDGTEAGTTLVKDVRPGDYDSYPTNLTEVAGTVYFTAGDGLHGRELWRSDGTAAGTTLVKDIDPTADGRPRSLTASGGKLYFSADDRVHGQELWRSDGTADGTTMVKDIDLGGAFDVASKGAADTDKGTLRLRVVVDGPGTLVVAPAGKRWIRKVTVEIGPSDSARTSVVLRPTRAALRELRRNGRLRVGAQFTFTSCGGGTSSRTEHYTLTLR